MTYHMHNKQTRLGFRTPNGGVSGLVWPGRIHDAGEWIKKDLAGKLERHAVLHEIRVSLGGRANCGLLRYLSYSPTKRPAPFSAGLDSWCRFASYDPATRHQLYFSASAT